MWQADSPGLREAEGPGAVHTLEAAGSNQAAVPLDRDPVPDRFGEAVRRYYERLGSGQ